MIFIERFLNGVFFQEHAPQVHCAKKETPAEWLRPRIPRVDVPMFAMRIYNDSRIPRVINKRSFSNMNLKKPKIHKIHNDDLEEVFITSRFLNVYLGSTLEHFWPETTFSQIRSMI